MKQRITIEQLNELTEEKKELRHEISKRFEEAVCREWDRTWTLLGAGRAEPTMFVEQPTRVNFVLNPDAY